MQIYEELKARGLIAQVTDETEIRELINNGGARFYIGFDPTADSLHVGHFMALCLMKRLQMAGNKPVVLLGGGTGYIGDPSGRTDMRSMMSPETIEHNCECFLKQISKFIDFGEDKAIAVNNADWLLKLNYIELLRDVGSCFSVNNMLRAECYKQRMEKGLSFLEFNYMIMQSYDFLYLHNNYGCNMQFGGDDQWSNMLAGTGLIRRKNGEDAYAMTITLLMNSEGKKMGKTAKGAVWLDPEKTTPYEFYQYWRNIDDADVMKCIRMLTFISLEEIEEMENWDASRINEKKEVLAYSLTELVHGREEVDKAKAAAYALFTGEGDDSNMPTTEVPASEISTEGLAVADILVKCNLAKSKGEARRLVEQGGITIDGNKVTDVYSMIDCETLANGIKIKKGKKAGKNESKLSITRDVLEECNEYIQPDPEDEFMEDIIMMEIAERVEAYQFDDALAYCDELIAEGKGEMANTAIGIYDKYIDLLFNGASAEDIDAAWDEQRKYVKIYIHHMMQRFRLSKDDFLE